MNNEPTLLSCIAPLHYLCQDYNRVGLASMGIEGGTVLLFEKNGERYLMTALHVWRGIQKLSDASEGDIPLDEGGDKYGAGRSHGAFVYAGKIMPLRKDEPHILQDEASDIIVMQPEWLKSEMTGQEFYRGEAVTVSRNERVTTWGFPRNARTLENELLTCGAEELEGKATDLRDGKFKFSTGTKYHLGGFSGAPVSRSDGKLVGMVSEALSENGIVTCFSLDKIFGAL